jgi:hypothetical protein
MLKKALLQATVITSSIYKFNFQLFKFNIALQIFVLSTLQSTTITKLCYIYIYTDILIKCSGHKNRPDAHAFHSLGLLSVFLLRKATIKVYLLGKQVINHALNCVNANLLLKAYSLIYLSAEHVCHVCFMMRSTKR